MKSFVLWAQLGVEGFNLFTHSCFALFLAISGKRFIEGQDQLAESFMNLETDNHNNFLKSAELLAEIPKAF